MKTKTRLLTTLVVGLTALGIGRGLAAERTDKVFIQGNPAGKQTVNEEAGGGVRVEYSYNDRGRGDNIVADVEARCCGCANRG